MIRCYYKILGVETGASQTEIKQAFRRIAMRCHPDRNPSDPAAKERFRDAVEAYEVLADPRRRKQYDRLRGHRPRGGDGFHDTGFRTSGRGRTADEVFHEYFGFARQNQCADRHHDLRFDLQVTAADLSHGLSDDIRYSRVVFCQRCMGRGRIGISGDCPHCGGTGEIEEPVSINVTIPAGCENGTRLRVPGAGDRPHPGMQPGDLVILVHVSPSN